MQKFNEQQLKPDCVHFVSLKASFCVALFT
jgi:hypothetical protein